MLGCFLTILISFLGSAITLSHFETCAFSSVAFVESQKDLDSDILRLLLLAENAFQAVDCKFLFFWAFCSKIALWAKLGNLFHAEGVHLFVQGIEQRARWGIFYARWRK